MSSMSFSHMSIWEIGPVLRRKEVFSDISLEQARQILTDNCPVLSGEIVSADQAVNRILHQPIYAPHDLPPKAQSAVDGYALGTGDGQVGSSYELTVRLELDSRPRLSLEDGQAAAVQTGGILPDGTVAVVPEEKSRENKQQITIQEMIKPGTNIKAAGEDYLQGGLLLSAGERIDYAAIALLSAYGLYEVETVRKPQVAVICLANNIIDKNLQPQNGQMRDGNGPMLNALITQDGGVMNRLVYGGSIELHDLAAQLRQEVEKTDIIIFTGGTFENGESNFVKIVGALDAELLFQGIQLQPGSHAGAARKDNCILLSLSGNPAACAVNYHLLGRLVLQRMQGLEGQWQRIKAGCTNGFAKKSNSRRMVRGQAWWTEEGWQVAVLPGQKPSMLRSLMKCNAFLDLPAGNPPIEAGHDVMIILLTPEGIVRRG